MFICLDVIRMIVNKFCVDSSTSSIVVKVKSYIYHTIC